MGGILQNKDEAKNSREFNRDAVLENTRLNSQLGEQGEQLRRKIASQQKSDQKTAYPKTKAPPSSLKFDDEELAAYDQQRGQHMHVDEPKTPFMGTAETTEYYDNEEISEPEEFDLGEAVNDQDA